MPRPTILTSLHGRQIGLSKNSELIFNDAGVAMTDGVLEPLHVTRKSLTAAQMQAGFSAPTELVAAPGAGFAILVERLVVSLPAGTVFAGVAAGEDLIIVHSGGTDPLVTTIETTGFLDSAVDETRIARAVDPTGTYDLTALANTAVDYELLVGDITGGRACLFDVYWHRIDLTAFTV